MADGSTRPAQAATGECTPQQRFPKLASLIDYLDSLTDRADLDVLEQLLREIDVSRCDLDPSCAFCDERYQRNIIKESAWYELVCLCWKSGQRTPIHDHRGSSCAFKVIENAATEIRFEKSPSGLLCSSGTFVATPGYICASHDEDIHQVLNANPPGEDVITLHIYSPPLKNYRRYSLDSPTCDGQMEECTLHARAAM
ncbi:MAG: cysteine dioxygenase [Phycisphaerales bacterium]